MANKCECFICILIYMQLIYVHFIYIYKMLTVQLFWMQLQPLQWLIKRKQTPKIIVEFSALYICQMKNDFARDLHPDAS